MVRIHEQVKLNNLFLNCRQYKPTIHETGVTRRTRTGKSFTQSVAKYKSFRLQLEGISPFLHSQLLYIINLNRGYNDTQAENLNFIDYQGDKYEVIIPMDGYDFEVEEGEELTYSWEITLETAGSI